MCELGRSCRTIGILALPGSETKSFGAFMNVCRASILSVTVCAATPKLAAQTVNAGGSEARAAPILQPVPRATGAAPKLPPG